MSSETIRNHLVAAYQAGVAAADPARAVRDALNRRGPELDYASRIVVLGLGKAAARMAQAALPYFKARDYFGTVVTTGSEVIELDGLTVMSGQHPVPDATSLAAGNALLATAAEAREGDLVLALMSGGGSALAVSPKAGVSLPDKIAIGEHLLKCGANINEMNAVRRAISKIKGGQLAAAAAPAYVLTLAVSDVPNDDLAVIASGPTVAPQDLPALQPILERYQFDNSLRKIILSAQTDPVVRDSQAGDGAVIASNSISKAATTAYLRHQGYQVKQLDGWLDLNVDAAASLLLSSLHDVAASGKPCALVAGGEPTVRVTGAGKGGRNQELSLRFALAEASRRLPCSWGFLSCGTDGRDGPTDAAGAIVDSHTISAIVAQGLSVETELANNNAYVPLNAANALLRPGSTGTNVADLQIGIIA